VRRLNGRVNDGEARGEKWPVEAAKLQLISTGRGCELYACQRQARRFSGTGMCPGGTHAHANLSTMPCTLTFQVRPAKLISPRPPISWI